MVLNIKISQTISVEVPDDVKPGTDTEWRCVDAFLKDPVNRANLDFVVDEVDGSTDHPLVDNIVG